ncbi:uncharacterized protein C14orf119-like [Uranotaenia lowii]|uniref:uncharacterized protein C14orf119-like n=1 Tax=Uranotaenia lowii TaxID=190385 RepID=UPI002479ABEF|nr:uncharacterized protein C14orf119-like [Uranotaenia lowii]
MSTAALANGLNLTVDREFRYIVQWFTEWSEFQREDFVPVLASHLASLQGGNQPAYVNGIISAMAAVSSQDKPMSLFQCRVKLFNEWSSKWPEGQGAKLLERLTEIDSDFGHQVEQELAGNGRSTQPNSNEPFTNFSDDPEESSTPQLVVTPSVSEHHSSNGNNVTIVSISAPDSDLMNAEPIALVIGEE